MADDLNGLVKPAPIQDFAFADIEWPEKGTDDLISDVLANMDPLLEKTGL
jgi:hypothetical protein